MAVAEETKTDKTESRPFQADVAKLLHLMVHSVYSDKSVFLRELIANAADACERLRYEAIAEPSLLGDDAKPHITVALDAENKTLAVEDNGIGMSREEMIEALGTIARSGTKAFLERLEAAQKEGEGEGNALIGRFGVGFYSAFMVAERVDVISRRAGTDAAWQWSSDGKGAFDVAPVAGVQAAPRGTRVVLHLMDEAKQYAERATVEPLIKAQSGHVPVPIAIVDKPGAAPAEITDGAALWAKPKADISAADYTDFYRSIAVAFDEPALTIHFRAEGRQDYTALLFVPSSRPFDLFDPDRSGRIKLYVKRVFIADDAEILPRYLRFVRGLVELGRPAAQRLARENPGESAACRDQERRDQPRARRVGAARRQGAAEFRQDLGHLRRRREGRHLRGFRAPRYASKAGALQDHGVARRMAQPQRLCRGAQAQSDRNLLYRRRRHRAAESIAASRRLSRPRRRGAAVARSGRHVLGHVRHRFRRQAVQVGDAGRGRPGVDSAARYGKGTAAPKSPRRSSNSWSSCKGRWAMR